MTVARSLLDLSTPELRHELKLRGLDADDAADRSSLLEHAASSGLLPANLGPVVSHSSRRVLASDFAGTGHIAPAPVTTVMRRIAVGDHVLPGAMSFTDGERLAIPLWSEIDDTCRNTGEPLWFVLDSAITRSVISDSMARRLGVPPDGGKLRALRFAGEPVDELDVRVVPDQFSVLGDPREGIAGLLGPDFLHGWDIDLNVTLQRCHAWPAMHQLHRGFGWREALEVEVTGTRGLLEVRARLRNGLPDDPEQVGKPVRAVVDLGQTYSSCNWLAAEQMGITRNSPSVHHAGEWMTLGGEEAKVYETHCDVELDGRIAGVLRGTRVFANRIFWVSDSLPLLEKLGFSPAEPLAVLGLDTVGRSRLTVSARHRLLCIPQ